MRNKAFTLAEVLITLGIIGVVAALTLPSLITNIRYKGYAEKFKKTYSVLQTATNRIVFEEGPPGTWDFSAYENTNGSPEDVRIFNWYAQQIKNVKTCPFVSSSSKCLFSNSEIYALNGEQAPATWTNTSMIYQCSYMLYPADGSSIGIMFPHTRPGCYIWAMTQRNIALFFLVDINGKNKPNTLGRDIFFLIMDMDGKITPYSMDDISDCNKDGKGQSCAARVLQEGKMDY